MKSFNKVCALPLPFGGLRSTPKTNIYLHVQYALVWNKIETDVLSVAGHSWHMDKHEWKASSLLGFLRMSICDKPRQTRGLIRCFDLPYVPGRTIPLFLLLSEFSCHICHPQCLSLDVMKCIILALRSWLTMYTVSQLVSKLIIVDIYPLTYWLLFIRKTSP